MLSYILNIALGTMAVCLVFILIRFVKGPSLSDRIIALDLFATTLIGIIGLYAMHTAKQSFVDVAIILSLIAFLGSMSFAYYLVRGK